MSDRTQAAVKNVNMLIYNNVKGTWSRPLENKTQMFFFPRNKFQKNSSCVVFILGLFIVWSGIAG